MVVTSTQFGAALLPGDSRTPEKPYCLILYAVGWMLAAQVLSGFAAFTESFINSAMGHQTGVPSYIAYPVSVLATQMVFLFAAIHRGRIMAESGTLPVALGNVPSKRRWPLITAGFVIAAWAGMLALALFVSPVPVSSPYGFNIASALGTGGWVSTSVILLAAIVVAPVSEELFFRGWLWEGLRRSWRPVAARAGDGGNGSAVGVRPRPR